MMPVDLGGALPSARKEASARQPTASGSGRLAGRSPNNYTARSAAGTLVAADPSSLLIAPDDRPIRCCGSFSNMAVRAVGRGAIG